MGGNGGRAETLSGPVRSPLPSAQNHAEKSDQTTGEKGEAAGGVCPGEVNSLGPEWLRSRMPPEHMELWVRIFEIKDGALRQVVVGWLWNLGALLPQGCLDYRAAATCVSQNAMFWTGRNSGRSLGSGWPGRRWQGYSPLAGPEGTGSEAKACLSSKVV